MWKRRLFQRLAEPLDPARVTTLRRGDTLLRTVDARTIIERLNRVCPGAWSFEVEPVYPGPGLARPSGGHDGGWVVRGRLTIAGMAQEDFGASYPDAIDPPKAAVSDALKRCAVHFGIGLELYAEGLYPLTPGPGSAGHGAAVSRPMTPAVLRSAIRAMIAAQPPHLADAQPGPADVRRLIIRVKRLGLTDDQRHALAERLFGVSSFKALTASQAGALWDWSADVASARAEALELLKDAA